jgi:serine/threonine protein kinase
MEHRLKYGYSGERPFKEDDNLSFYKGYHKGQGVSVLICEFKITGGTSEKNAMKKQVMLTLEPILDRISRIDHKNVAKIYDVVKTDSGLVVVQEDCAQGTLMSLLKTHEFIEEKLAIFITKQVAQGLQ